MSQPTDENCPTCGQPLERAPILNVGGMEYGGDGDWHLSNWQFGNAHTALIGGWSLEELAEFATILGR